MARFTSERVATVVEHARRASDECMSWDLLRLLAASEWLELAYERSERGGWGRPSEIIECAFQNVQFAISAARGNEPEDAATDDCPF